MTTRPSLRCYLQSTGPCPTRSPHEAIAGNSSRRGTPIALSDTSLPRASSDQIESVADDHVVDQLEGSLRPAARAQVIRFHLV